MSVHAKVDIGDRYLPRHALRVVSGHAKKGCALGLILQMCSAQPLKTLFR